MSVAGLTRLPELGGGVALLLSPFGQQVLTWFVLWAVSLGLLHLVLSGIRGRLPLALFCLLAGLSSAALGTFVLLDLLREHAKRSWGSALIWGPGFAVGFFLLGVLGAAAWAALTLSLSRLLGRRGQREE